MFEKSMKQEYATGKEMDKAIKERMDKYSKAVLYGMLDASNEKIRKYLPMINIHISALENPSMDMCINTRESLSVMPLTPFGGPERTLLQITQYGSPTAEVSKGEYRVDYRGGIQIYGGSWKNKIQALLKIAAGGSLYDLNQIVSEIEDINTGVFSHNREEDLILTWKFALEKIAVGEPFSKNDGKRKEVWVMTGLNLRTHGDVQISFGTTPQKRRGIYQPEDYAPDRVHLVLSSEQESLVIDSNYEYHISRTDEVSSLMDNPKGLVNDGDKLLVDMVFPGYKHMMLEGDNGFYHQIDQEIINRRKFNAIFNA